jgi:hypothetical protein
MPEAGGTSTQTGIYYQNSVAAFWLADILSFDPRGPRERVVEVRVEAPDRVDDIVVRFADGHRNFVSAKSRLHAGDDAWKRMWRNLSAQFEATDFNVEDVITVMVAERSNDSVDVMELCERARTSLDKKEFISRLTQRQRSLFEGIEVAVGAGHDVLAMLRTTTVKHQDVGELEREIARRRLAGEQIPGASLISTLRDIAGGEARRRGLFRAAPLRRMLKLDHQILLEEPREWGLSGYRRMVSDLALIQIPGSDRKGTADELFVWPRARDYQARHSDFEDELEQTRFRSEEPTVDLSLFPSDELRRVIIVAGPGHGKSALLTALSGRLSEGPFVPVSVPLASLAKSGLGVMDFVARQVQLEMDAQADWRLLAEQGLLVLMFDGLDEVPATARPALLDKISKYGVRNPDAPWILTVRDPAVITRPTNARTIELLALSDEDMVRFVDVICGPHKDNWAVVRRLSHRTDLYKLARIPLFLTMMLATVDLTSPTPLTRSDLIEAYLKTLFSPAEHKPVADGEDYSVELRVIAERLAFERLERQEIGATESEVWDAISRAAPDKDRGALFQQLLANGILKRQSSIRLQFPYPIVQEYLAARYIITNVPETLEQRIQDAVQRPWAQVIQFALELHPEPEPIIAAMLGQPDDAFVTGLRLVGRCIANGAKVSDQVRSDVADRLVEYWIHAAWDARERVGRLIADGFVAPPGERLKAALHHRWLINDGGGEILSLVRDQSLTLSVLDSLMHNDSSSHMIYHAFKPALDLAGDDALQAINGAMIDAGDDEELVRNLASLLGNFSTTAVSRELVLTIGRNARFPRAARLDAYHLAGAPLEAEARQLMHEELKLDDSYGRYDAIRMLAMTENPAEELRAALLEQATGKKARLDLAGSVTAVLPDPEQRQAFISAMLAEPTLNSEVKHRLQLFGARHGDKAMFRHLIEELATLPIEPAGTAMSLFGHYRDAELVRTALSELRQRQMTADDMRRLAGDISTGMRYIFEMDFGIGGALKSSPAHPGLRDCVALLEDWLSNDCFAPHEKLAVATAASELGSDVGISMVEQTLLGISDFDEAVWNPPGSSGGPDGYIISRALYELERRKPQMPVGTVEGLLASSQYNVAMHGVSALGAIGHRAALERLIRYHASVQDWHLRSTVETEIERLASRLGIIVKKEGSNFVLACDVT